MNISKKFLIIFISFLLITSNIIAEEEKDNQNLLEEELPAVNPFLGGGSGSAGMSSGDGLSSDSQNPSNSVSLKNLKLSGVIISQNKNFAIFSYPDGRTVKYEEDTILSSNIMLLDIFFDGVYIKMNDLNYSLDLNNNLLQVEQ
tara:strand:+ start:4887 stop:5318 length:432 start_codon:yes stop_codon:yes gene_type:complete